MYIKELHLSNFQCHTGLSLKFGPNVNAITGESDRGKSAIIRALRWLLFNKPIGQQMRKHRSAETSVKIVLDNGVEVERIRSKSVNRYILTRPGHEPEVYDNFGKVVPEPVTNLLGVFLADFGNEIVHELSLASQFEGPFLLRETGGTRAHMLGHISRTGIIDSSVRLLNADVKMRGRQIVLLKESAQSLNEERRRFDGLEEYGMKVQELEREISALKNEKDRLDTADRIARRLHDVDATINTSKRALERLVDPPSIDEAERNARAYDRGNKLRVRVNELRDEIHSVSRRLSTLDVATAMPVNGIEEAARSLELAMDFVARAKDWKVRMGLTAHDSETLESELNQAKESFVDVVRKEGKCPTCFRDVDDAAVETILQEL